jgi:hypothetical protein
MIERTYVHQRRAGAVLEDLALPDAAEEGALLDGEDPGEPDLVAARVCAFLLCV